jgi:GNAT superfamily N-acetyltransferase
MTELAAGEHDELEDGTASTTPEGDNLVLDFARAEAAAFGALVESAGGRVSDDDDAGLHLRDLGSGSAFGNPALLTRPVPDAQGPATVRRIDDFYRAGTGGPYLVFSPWRTTDWSELGLQRVGHPPLMFRPPGGERVVVEGVEVEPVEHEDALAELERTLIEAYPVPELQPWKRGAFLAPAVLGTRWRFFLGRRDGEVVATAGAYLGAAITLVELVSTLPAARGRGIGAAVTSAASLAEPRNPAMLLSSDDGNGVYRSLGYLPLQRYTMWLGVR